MLKKGTKPCSATCPVIFAILTGPPNCDESPDPVIIFPRYFSDVVVTNQTSLKE